TNYSSFGKTVLDPFMGSGTTGIACIKSGRKFIGIESNEQYFSAAVNRFKNACGDFNLTAEEENSGQLALFGAQS
ncbi:MAG: DNA methyltransferase, partial [Pseudomonadota bacterium]